jgi:glycosyltransferase involved in cell wall biosynthesis
MSKGGTRRPATVVHLLPIDVARGAQVYLHALRDTLTRWGDEHRIVTLFGTAVSASGADLALGVPPGRLRSAGFDPRVALRLRRALRGLRPDIVVAHGGEPLKYAALVRPRRTPLVYLKIGMSRPALRGRLQLALLRALARRADVVAAVSEERVEEALELLELPADRVVLIPNGRDPDKYRPAPARPAREVPRLVFVGQLTPAKRPELFCAVARALRDRGRPVEAILVGDGPLLERLRPVAGSAGVEVLGRRGDVPVLLAGCDVLLLTGDQVEGMPGVLIEAGLCGLPVVTTDVPGARTVVEDGVTGFVVGLHDRDALIERTEQLAADRALRERLGSAARERCLERFTIEASADRWRALLDAVLDGEGLARRDDASPAKPALP